MGTKGLSTKQQHLELSLLSVFSSHCDKEREKGNTLSKSSRVFILDPLMLISEIQNVCNLSEIQGEPGSQGRTQFFPILGQQIQTKAARWQCVL